MLGKNTPLFLEYYWYILSKKMIRYYSVKEILSCHTNRKENITQELATNCYEPAIQAEYIILTYATSRSVVFLHPVVGSTLREENERRAFRPL
jgi:hypothetical protein